MPGSHHFTTSRHLGSTPFSGAGTGKRHAVLLADDHPSSFVFILQRFASVSRRACLQMCRGMPKRVAEVPPRSAFGAPEVGGGGPSCSSEASASSDDFSFLSKRSPSTISSLCGLIGTHALCSSRRQSRPTASSAHPRQGSVWSWSCAKPSGTFLLLGTHPGFLYPVSSWCCLLRPSSPAQHALPHAMLFGHFVHLFHCLIHSHLLICRSDLGHLHPPSSTDLPGQRCVFNRVHFSGTGDTEVGPSPMLCTERYPSLSHSATVMAVSCISQLESVMI